jgi:hypothetical protein
MDPVSLRIKHGIRAIRWVAGMARFRRGSGRGLRLRGRLRGPLQPEHGCGFFQPVPQLQRFPVHPRAAQEQADLAAERLHLGGMTAGLERVAIALRSAPPALGRDGRGIVLQNFDFRGARLGHAGA